MDYEQKQDEVILFPIRLDDEVLGIEAGWAAYIRRTRHVGDFREQEDQVAYQKALTWLLRNLGVA